MKRLPPPKTKSGIPASLAAFSGLAAIALVVVLLVLGSRATRPVEVTPEALSGIEGAALVIEISPEGRWLYEAIEDAHRFPYSLNELESQAVALTNGNVQILPVRIMIQEDTKAGEILEITDDLKALGIRSYEINVK